MPGGHPGHDALTKRIPSVRAEVAASPFARSVLDSIVPCPHGRDTYLLKEQVFYHACCRAGCWVRTSNVWTWLRRMMNHPDQTSAALREPSNQKAMLKFRIEELRDAAGARDETRPACEEFLKDWSDSKYVECVPRPADATHTLRTMGKKPADGEAPKSYKCSALRGFRIEPPPHLGDVPLNRERLELGKACSQLGLVCRGRLHAGLHPAQRLLQVAHHHAHVNDKGRRRGSRGRLRREGHARLAVVAVVGVAAALLHDTVRAVRPPLRVKVGVARVVPQHARDSDEHLAVERIAVKEHGPVAQ